MVKLTVFFYFCLIFNIGDGGWGEMNKFILFPKLTFHTMIRKVFKAKTFRIWQSKPVLCLYILLNIIASKPELCLEILLNTVESKPVLY